MVACAHGSEHSHGTQHTLTGLLVCGVGQGWAYTCIRAGMGAFLRGEYAGTCASMEYCIVKKLYYTIVDSVLYDLTSTFMSCCEGNSLVRASTERPLPRQNAQIRNFH